MAPPAAGTAPAQRQARRPLSRIVPAIPHRLSRTIPSARPITPEESSKGAVLQNGAGSEPQAVAEKQPEEQLPPTNAVNAPMTPDSRSAGDAKSEMEATTVLAASPAESAEDDVDCAPDGNLKSDTNGDAGPPALPYVESKPVTNGHHRKLNIPTELPPPFYPSSKVDTQTPPVDGNDLVPPSSHRSQLSAGATVFSIQNGSPATPATPYNVEQEQHVQQPALARAPPGFAPPEFTPLFFPGHAHHPSDAGAPWPYPPYPVPVQDHVYGNGADRQAPSFPTETIAHAIPFDNGLPHREVMNGTTPTHSQSPNKSHFGEVKPSSEHGDGQRILQYQNGMSSHEGMEESPFELAAYLSTQFGNPEFADFILQIRSPESMLVSIPVHGIVVVRSPVIAEAVRRSVPTAHRSRDTRRILDVLVQDPFVTRESLEEAVKVLYGAPLLSTQTFLYGIAPYAYDSDQPSSSDARRRMRQLLSYIAAGRALQLPSMQARGVEIARSLLRWDTVDEVLPVALRTSSASQAKDGFEQDNPFTAALVNYAIEFMASTFPVDFMLDTIAPELQDLPRLPALREPRPSTHNPRLSKIRFGDAPPGDGLQPGHASRVLSSVLLSLPLTLVDRLLNHRATANQIGWTGVVKVMRDVVNEREKRRQKALKGEVRPAADGIVPATLLNNMHLEERVEQVEESLLHPSGHRLVAQQLDETV